MNKISKRFLIGSIVVTILPLIIGLLIIDKRVAENLSQIPVDVENFALDYINTETDIIDSSPMKIYDYEKETSSSALVHKVSIFEKSQSTNEVILKTIEIENNENQYLVRAYNQMIFKSNHILKYGFSLILMALFVLCFYTSALCFETTKKDKWKRSLFILCGVGTISLNWATGIPEFNLTSMALPPVGINFGGTYPTYSLLLHLPIGLLFYWIKWRKEDKKIESGFIGV